MPPWTYPFLLTNHINFEKRKEKKNRKIREPFTEHIQYLHSDQIMFGNLFDYPQKGSLNFLKSLFLKLSSYFF